MGKIRKTYSVEFKAKVIDMYEKEGRGAKSIGRELGIAYSMIDRWIQHYKREGLPGLEEKRGKASGGIRRGRPRTKSLTDQEKIQRLEMENEYLKKLLAIRKELE